LNEIKETQAEDLLSPNRFELNLKQITGSDPYRTDKMTTMEDPAIRVTEGDADYVVMSKDKRFDIGSQLRSLKVQQQPAKNSAKSSAKLEQVENLRWFIKNNNIDEQNLKKMIDRIRHMRAAEYEQMTYENFLKFFDADDNEFSKIVFEYTSVNKKNLDLRKFLTSSCPHLEVSVEEKINYVYSIYDLEKNGYILYEELVDILHTLQLGEDPVKIEKKLNAILIKKSISQEEYISREDFHSIVKMYPNTFNPPVY